ncbi:hypothetical protein OF83DRAFT_227663 [Amylostereum chailletii]|nr:hypothetical protein OF83DRAFT_227663 [Amylostereum chailletii]
MAHRSLFKTVAARFKRPRLHRAKSSSLELEVLAFGLETLNESADVCTPLKAAVGGLLCFVARAKDMVSNEEDVQYLVRRIEEVEEKMLNAFSGDPRTIAPDQRSALETFRLSIDKICYDMEDSMSMNESRVKRFFLAKKWKGDLNRFMMRLNAVDADFQVRTVVLDSYDDVLKIFVRIQRTLKMCTNREVHRISIAQSQSSQSSQSIRIDIHEMLLNQEKIARHYKLLSVVCFFVQPASMVSCHTVLGPSDP